MITRPRVGGCAQCWWCGELSRRCSGITGGSSTRNWQAAESRHREGHSLADLLVIQPIVVGHGWRQVPSTRWADPGCDIGDRVR